MRRQFVHLSPDTETAKKVACRRTDAPVILTVDARSAHEAGVQFRSTGDQTWLADPIEAEFLTIPEP